MTLINNISGKLSRLTLSDLTLFFEACFWLTLASILRVTVPFRWYVPLFGETIKEEPSVSATSPKNQQAIAVAKAVARGSRYLPMACKCLVQALSAKAMLRLRGITTVVFIGVANKKEEKDVEEKGFIAHAWVKCGAYYVCGGRERFGHKVIAIFTEA